MTRPASQPGWYGVRTRLSAENQMAAGAVWERTAPIAALDVLLGIVHQVEAAA